MLFPNFKHVQKETYISMKMEPNGSTPPNTTITLGSINLQI